MKKLSLLYLCLCLFSVAAATSTVNKTSMNISQYTVPVKFEVRKSLCFIVSSEIDKKYLLLRSYDLKTWIPDQATTAYGKYISFTVFIETNQTVFYQILTTESNNKYAD